MIAYEFYSRDESDEIHLVGVLPERRRDPERITNASILNWVKQLVGDEADGQDIFFSTIRLEKSENGNFYPIPKS